MNTVCKLLIMVCCAVCPLRAAAQATGHWAIDIYDYQYDMTAYVALQVDGTPVTAATCGDYEVAAFCGSECRGVAEFRTAGTDGQQTLYGYLRIRSNEASGETVSFRVYCRSAAMEFAVDDVTLTFADNAVSGMPSSPLVLRVVTVAEWDENAAEPPAASGPLARVTVRRTINADEWSTLCLPFAMSQEQCKAAFGDDVQMGDFTGCTVDADKNIAVMFATVTALEANHPYVVKCSAAVSEFTVEGVNVVAGAEARVDHDYDGQQYNSFIGTYASGTLVPNRCLFVSGGKFYFSTGQTAMKGFRGYFSFDAAGADYANYAEARVTMAFGVPTAVRAASAGTAAEGAVYDLSGRRSNGLRRGIYVREGKKVVMK